MEISGELVVAWTFFDCQERAVFRASADLPADAWARARGWALWKALITLVDAPGHPAQARALAALLGEV